MDLSEIEMAKLYWEEFKYRHDHYWKSFFKFAFAILFLIVIPYAYPDKIQSVKEFSIFFPGIALMLSIISAWLLAAEYERISVIYRKFNEIKPEGLKPIPLVLSGPKKVLGLKIGTVVTFLFGGFFVSLSVAEIIFMLCG